MKKKKEKKLTIEDVFRKHGYIIKEDKKEKGGYFIFGPKPNNGED